MGFAGDFLATVFFLAGDLAFDLAGDLAFEAGFAGDFFAAGLAALGDFAAGFDAFGDLAAGLGLFLGVAFFGAGLRVNAFARITQKDTACYFLGLFLADAGLAGDFLALAAGLWWGVW